MINNNTQKKTNVSVGTKKETEIYLKKSELPKDVSSFRNDVGYISQSSLDSWLKEHNYIPENEINILIGEAYPIIVRDHSDGIIDGDISDIKGEIVAIKDRLRDVESEYTSIIEREGQYAKSDDIPSLTGYATEEWVEGQGYLKEHQPLDSYAEKTWVESQGYITSTVLSGYATKSSLNVYAKKSEIPSVDGLATESWVEGQGYITSTDISGKADKSELTGYVKTNTLNKYLKKTDMPDRNDIALKSDIPSVDGLAAESWVESQGYITSAVLSGYATKEWVKNQGYGTGSQQSLDEYAKKTDIPDITNLATKDEIPSLNGYATKNWVFNKQYITKDDIPSLTGYATKEWVEGQGYLKNADLSEYVKSSTLTNYAKKSDLNAYVKENDMDTIIEGYNFLTSSDLSDYAKQTDIPDLSGYVKSSTLTNYAKASNVYSKSQADSKFISKDSIEDIYATKTDVDSKYLSKKDARNTYLQIEDYRGIGDASVISDEFKEYSNAEFEEILSNTNLRNGFYIVNGNDVVIIKNNTITRFVDNGQHILWQEF